MASSALHDDLNPRCWMDFKHGDEKLGRVQFELFSKITPKTARNFIALCQTKKYKKSIVHRVIPNFMIQMGDYERGDGTGGASIYGEQFEDENFKLKHGKYMLSMANAGPNTNGSQFFICTADCTHLNGKHVVFGHVVAGKDVIDRIEAVKTTEESNRPIVPVVISKCGQMMLKSSSLEKSESVQSNQINNQSIERKKPKDSDSEMDDGDSHRSRSQDTNSSVEDSDDGMNTVRKKKRKRKREFHLESVNFVDEAGRTRKGKGNFRYSDSSRSERRVYGARNGRDDPQRDYRGHEREQGGRRIKEEYDDYRRKNVAESDNDSPDGRDSNAIEILYEVHLEGLMMGPDAKKVSSLVSTYSPDELDRQEREEWKAGLSEHDDDPITEFPSRSPLLTSASD